MYPDVSREGSPDGRPPLFHLGGILPSLALDFRLDLDDDPRQILQPGPLQPGLSQQPARALTQHIHHRRAKQPIPPLPRQRVPYRVHRAQVVGRGEEGIGFVEDEEGEGGEGEVFACAGKGGGGGGGGGVQGGGEVGGDAAGGADDDGRRGGQGG